MFKSTPADISRFWSILGIQDPFAFHVFLLRDVITSKNERSTKKPQIESVHGLFKTTLKSSQKVQLMDTLENCPTRPQHEGK